MDLGQEEDRRQLSSYISRYSMKVGSLRPETLYRPLRHAIHSLDAEVMGKISGVESWVTD
jgi:hypothetical protein